MLAADSRAHLTSRRGLAPAGGTPRPGPARRCTLQWPAAHPGCACHSRRGRWQVESEPARTCGRSMNGGNSMHTRPGPPAPPAPAHRSQFTPRQIVPRCCSHARRSMAGASPAAMRARHASTAPCKTGMWRGRRESARRHVPQLTDKRWGCQPARLLQLTHSRLCVPCVWGRTQGFPGPEGGSALQGRGQGGAGLSRPWPGRRPASLSCHPPRLPPTAAAAASAPPGRVCGTRLARA